MKGALGAVLAVLLLVVCAAHAGAEFAGISRAEFEPHYQPQQTPTWCWASSIEMVLSYEGISLPQGAVVARAKGAAYDGPATPYDIIRSTNGVYTDTDKARVVISGQFVTGPPLATVLLNQVAHRRPVILTYLPAAAGGWAGHVVVLTGVDYSITKGHEVVVSRVHVFDPFPYRLVPDMMGGAHLKEDNSLRYHEYGLVARPYGLQMMSRSGPAGIITGVILIDSFKLPNQSGSD